MATGIHVASTVAELTAASPHFDQKLHSYETTPHGLNGPCGHLIFETLKSYENDAGDDITTGARVVTWIRVEPIDA